MLGTLLTLILVVTAQSSAAWPETAGARSCEWVPHSSIQIGAHCKRIVEMQSATLTNVEGFLAEKPDLTLTINRSDLELVMIGAKELEDQIKDGTCKAEGDLSILKKLASTMVDFDPRFEIMPGTHPDNTKIEKHDPYEAVPGAAIAE